MNHLARLTHEDILGHGFTKRWHTAPTQRPQTLAEHAAKVAMIAAKLADRLNPKPTEAQLLGLLQDCLTHDAAEVIFGDLPNPGKVAINEFTGLDLDEQLEVRFWTAAARAEEDLAGPPRVLFHIRKLADILEATTFYWTEGAPGTYRAHLVLRECAKAIQAFPSQAVQDEAYSHLCAAEIPLVVLQAVGLMTREPKGGVA